MKIFHTQICTCGPKFADYKERQGYFYEISNNDKSVPGPTRFGYTYQLY